MTTRDQTVRVLPIRRDVAVTESPFLALGVRDAAHLAALGRGLIPRGGDHFTLGAGDLESRWLRKSDVMMTQVPKLVLLGYRCLLWSANYLWPLLFLLRFRRATSLDDGQCATMIRRVERLGFIGSKMVLLVKTLVFPAFYSLPEVKRAIGYPVVSS